MSFADSNLVSVRYSTETLWGETPATPAAKALRLTGESLAYEKTTLVSEELRADRQIPSIVVAGIEAAGDVKFELSGGGSFDDLIQSALSSATPVAASSVAVSTTVAAAGKTFTRGTGSWITDGFVVGQWIKFTGFTHPENDGPFRINTITATVLTVDDPETALVDEGPTSVGGTGKLMRNGVTKRSHFIEKYFSDITEFMYFTGMRVNQMQLRFTARQRVTGTFIFMGKQGFNAQVTQTASVAPATSTDIYTASASVGRLREYTNGGSVAALPVVIKEISMDVKNNLRAQPVVGQTGLAGIGYGRFEVTGSLQVYFADHSLLAQLINHTLVTLEFVCSDAANNSIAITLPAVRLTRGSPTATAVNTDVMATFDFEAQMDPVVGYMLQLDLM